MRADPGPPTGIRRGPPREDGGRRFGPAATAAPADPERAFFHDGPLALLATSDEPTAPLPRWLLAAALAGVGRFGAALDVLGLEPAAVLAGRPVAPGLDPGADPAACAVAASVCRQLELYPAARVLDVAGLVAATASDGAGRPVNATGGRRSPAGSGGAGSVHEGRFDCRLGLVADHVGLGDLTAARRLLPEAVAGAPDGWRPQVRLAWLDTESALLAGQAAVAVAAAQRALDVATAAAAPRHRAKSLLFLGVARQVCADSGDRPRSRLAPDPDGAAATLLTAATAAERLGAGPLAWPAWWQHAEAEGGGPDHPSRARSRAALVGVLAGLPPPLAAWVGSRPTPRRILAIPPEVMA